MKIPNNSKYFFYGFLTSVLLTGILIFIGIKYIKNYQAKEVEKYVNAETDMLSVDLFYINSENFESFQPISIKDKTKVNLKKKRFEFINFWATWCAPCVGELPIIKKLMTDSEINSLPIDFIFVNDEDIKKQLDFSNKKNLGLNFNYFKGNLPEEFKHKSIPATYIIDNDKKLIYQINGSQNWNSKLIKEFILNINKS